MFLTSKQHRTFVYLLVGTFFIHAMFMAVKLRDEFKKVTFKPEVIKITFVPESLKEVAAITKRQIVQSEDSANKEKPKDSAFLSDKDRTFDRQTRAQNVDIFKNAGVGNSTVTKTFEKPEASKKKNPSMKDLKLSDFGMQTGEPMPKEITRAPASASQQGLKNGNPLTQGFSATNDYVEEVTLGDFTHLNTVEYKYYGFFHRIRQKLEQFWGKSIKEKADNLFRAGRRLPASEDLITTLQITMNEKGEIIGVKILGASGVKELDDAAIESFNQAGPFPNPPKDLLVNGKAVIEWGFVVKS